MVEWGIFSAFLRSQRWERFNKYCSVLFVPIPPHLPRLLHVLLPFFSLLLAFLRSSLGANRSFVNRSPSFLHRPGTRSISATICFMKFARLSFVKCSILGVAMVAMSVCFLLSQSFLSTVSPGASHGTGNWCLSCVGEWNWRSFAILPGVFVTSKTPNTSFHAYVQCMLTPQLTACIGGKCGDLIKCSSSIFYCFVCCFFCSFAKIAAYYMLHHEMKTWFS